MRTKRLSLLHLLLFCFVVVVMGACASLELKDDNAPTFAASVEAEYDVKRWGTEQKSGWAAPPPRRKEVEGDWDVTAFRIRGQFRNAFAWYDAQGTFSQGFLQPEEHIASDGWSYLGTLVVMPGFAFGGGNVFIAAVAGMEGGYLGMEQTRDHNPSNTNWTEYGFLAMPFGCHIEATLGYMFTPSFTYVYAPTLATWGRASEGSSSRTKISLRFWPGALVSSMGPYLWVEGGWQWNAFEGSDFPATDAYEHEILLKGPYAAVGWRF